MIIIIDNYDSFTYNLVHYLGELLLLQKKDPAKEIAVFRNDRISLAGIADLRPDRIVISPGPCTPSEAGISVDVVKHFSGKMPLLGVCLGHQSIGAAFGGRIVHAKTIMHGKTSPIFHQQKGLFASIGSPFIATRYHSLVIERKSLPSLLQVTAWTDDGEIMGVAHCDHPTFGVQFHPESILTDVGKKILQNFLQL